MAIQKLQIKNMVCQRCITVVRSIVDQLSLPVTEIQLGEIIFQKELSKNQLIDFETELQQNGFELINSRVHHIIEKVKVCVLQYTSDLSNVERANLSQFITAKMPYDYTYLSNLFSSVEGQTIEHYFILQRIEKAKELLVYNQLSISEIALQLGYSSVHHLSSQFKKVTGLTPSYFKQIGITKRNSLDKL